MAFFSRSAPNPQPLPPANTVAASKKPRPVLHYLLWFLVVVIIGAVAWIAISGAVALKSIVATNNNDGQPTAILHSALTPADVKTEGDSRINILLAGIGGPGHSGPDLSDTLEIYSIDPVNKTAAVLSIPRDLYVTLSDGSHGRINAINTEGVQYCKKHACAVGSDQGGAAMEGMIGDLLGIKISYFVRLNFTGFQQLVDTLGGIDVTVATRLFDPLYPCPDPSTAYCPINIPAGAHHFNGATALQFARSRETSSDFARAARQQQVIAAMRDRALTAGILANPAKVTQLLNILGKNVKTDVQPGDLTTLINLIKQIDSAKTTTNVLDTAATGPLTSSVIGGADVLVPRLGLNDFSQVQQFVDNVLKDPYVQKEAATVAIVNASGRLVTGTTVESQLKNLGYNVVSLTTATPVQTASTVTTSQDKPYSAALLRQHFGATFVAATASSSVDIVVTIGTKYVTK